jgi:FAD/FMN-containing dehydrogenase
MISLMADRPRHGTVPAMRIPETTIPAPSAVGNRAAAHLRHRMLGEIITPADAGYEAARRVWNGAIDRRPALIARCVSVPDVSEAIRFAWRERLLTAVRGGGHSVAGHGTCEGGIVIDLSAMRSVGVNLDARTAWVHGGARWSDVDHATQAFGLATPGGLISSTGVSGLTLGGGIGWLSRKHGLSCDNLLAAELITAEGAAVRASEREHPDLFWALRGGGGNFGVVTRLEFRLHPVREVLGGALVVGLDDAATFLRGYRELAPLSPEELSTTLVFMTVPRSPEFPAQLHGNNVLAVAFCHAGQIEHGERAIVPFRNLVTPLLERVARMPYATRQRLQDPSAPAGLGNYWKFGYLTGLDDELIELIVARAEHTTSPRTQLHLYQLGGPITRVSQHETAYTHRAAPYLFSIVSVWDDPSSDASEHIDWTRSFWNELRPHTAGAYVNFLGEEGDQRVRDAYDTARYERLAAVKADHDPTNLFRLNQNVEPAA